MTGIEQQPNDSLVAGSPQQRRPTIFVPRVKARLAHLKQQLDYSLAVGSPQQRRPTVFVLRFEVRLAHLEQQLTTVACPKYGASVIVLVDGGFEEEY